VSTARLPVVDLLSIVETHEDIVADFDTIIYASCCLGADRTLKAWSYYGSQESAVQSCLSEVKTKSLMTEDVMDIFFTLYGR